MRNGNKKIRRRPVARSAVFAERCGTVQCVCVRMLQEGATVVVADSSVKNWCLYRLSVRDILVIVVRCRGRTVAAVSAPDTGRTHRAVAVCTFVAVDVCQPCSECSMSCYIP